MVTIHAGLNTARTWNLSTYTVGKHHLTSRHVDSGAKPRVSTCDLSFFLLLILSPSPPPSPSTLPPLSHYLQCCCVSGCDNFTIIGMSTGHVEMFSMQSGLHRGEFGAPRGEQDDGDVA